MESYSEALAAELDAVMREIPGAKPGKMFGMPGYKVNGKLAVSMFEDSVVAKLGAERSAELVGKAGIEAFEPMPGRVWKDWIRLRSDVKKQRALLEEAVRYVAEHSA